MTTINAAEVANLKQRRDDLFTRAQSAGVKVQNAVPFTGRTVDQQVAFLMAFSGLQSLQNPFQESEKCFNGLALGQATPEEFAKGDEFVKSMAELAKRMIQAVVEQIGVDEESVLPAIVKDLGVQLDRIETIVKHIEDCVAKAGL